MRNSITRLANKKSVYALLAVLISVMLITASAGYFSPVYAAKTASESETVRIGYFSNGDFMHENEDGTIEGYDIEYYYTLASYAGWNLKIVKYDSLDSALAALQDGDIDMLSGLAKTPEREAAFIASEIKMCTVYAAVQTRADDDRFAAGDTDTMNNMTCGIMAGSNIVTLYSAWCKANGLTPHIVEYPSIDERNAALADGKVDAIAGGSTVPGAQKVAEFPAMDLFFMMTKGNTKLKAELDRAMNMLSLQEPNYATDLYHKYFPASRNTKPSFSKYEKEYISSHKKLKIALLADNAPYSYEENGGSIAGILPEYYDHISKVTGIGFEYVLFDNKNEVWDALADGKVDIVGEFENNIYNGHELGFILTSPYAKLNMVRVSKAGKNKISVIAVSDCFKDLVQSSLKAMGSKDSIKTYSNADKCFRALKDGKVDAVVCPQPSATWMLNQDRTSEYTTTSFGSEAWQLAAAMNGGVDNNILRSIINKTIAVDGAYFNQLVASDSLNASYGLKGVFNRLSVSAIVAMSLVLVMLLIIAVAALVIIIRRRKKERQIEKQQAELEAAIEVNKARHAFFGMVSHDMRTPLNGIIGFADLASASDDIDEIKDNLGKIRTSGKVLGDLVNDTLIMSRIQNGKYELKPSKCVASDVLAGIIEPISEFAAARGVVFEDKVSSVCGSNIVVADKLSLQKVFLNLLTNAVKFTPPGGKVAFECSHDVKEDGKIYSVFKISDSGKGISKEFIPKMFEPFAQEKGTDTGIPGIGMGLSIVKSIVDAMGGSIEVSSTEGKGTVFTVHLDLDLIQSEMKEGSQDETNKADEAEFPGLIGKRALICEDNALNLQIVETILERSGMLTDGAENGQEGLNMFLASKPGYYDIILMDLRMPVMSGIAAAKAIRKLDRPDSLSVPIIAVSADAYQENVDECIASGMNGHIAKPIDASVLLKTVYEQLK